MQKICEYWRAKSLKYGDSSDKISKNTGIDGSLISLAVKRENAMRQFGNIGKSNRNFMMHNQMEGQRLIARTHKTTAFGQKTFKVGVLTPTILELVSTDACWPQLISSFGVGCG